MSTGERCPDCLRPRATSFGDWLDSDPEDKSNYTRCGAHDAIDDYGVIDCLTVALRRHRVLLDKADRVAQKVMALRSDKDNLEKEREMYEAMVEYRTARGGITDPVWEVLTRSTGWAK